MDLGLKDKKALIAGSSRGLGYALASVLAQEGCRVGLNARDEGRLQVSVKKLSAESGQQVFGFPGDVSEQSTPERLVDEAATTMGGLDLLVTNSGGMPPGPFDSFDDQSWQTAVDMYFMSHVRLIRAALPHLRESEAASVLTMTSYVVKEPVPNLVQSNSIRLATVGLTKSLALELGSAGIRFNSILPANTDTERIRQLAADRAARNGTTLEEEMAITGSKSPFGRVAQPEEFGKVAAFLLSPAASYLTGVMLVFDGGQYKGML
jgi:3-oxoacyl-[acyl-carrier protein] reductase